MTEVAVKAETRSETETERRRVENLAYTNAELARVGINHVVILGDTPALRDVLGPALEVETVGYSDSLVRAVNESATGGVASAIPISKNGESIERPNPEDGTNLQAILKAGCSALTYVKLVEGDDSTHIQFVIDAQKKLPKS